MAGTSWESWAYNVCLDRPWWVTSIGHLPDQGIELGYSALQADSLPAELPEKPPYMDTYTHFHKVTPMSCLNKAS